MEEFHASFSSSELTQTDVTRAANRVDRTTFHVVAFERELMHIQFRIASLCVAIDGPDLSGGVLYVSVCYSSQTLYSSGLSPVALTGMPMKLREQLHGLPFDRVYYFDLNLNLLHSTWCSILTSHPAHQRTTCVLRFKDFVSLGNCDEP